MEEEWEKQGGTGEEGGGGGGGIRARNGITTSGRLAAACLMKRPSGVDALSNRCLAYDKFFTLLLTAAAPSPLTLFAKQ